MSIDVLREKYLRERSQEIKFLKNKCAANGMGFGGHYIHSLYKLDLDMFYKYLQKLWAVYFSEVKEKSCKKLKNWNNLDIETYLQQNSKEVPHNVKTLILEDAAIDRMEKENVDRSVKRLESNYGTYTDRLTLSLVEFKKQYGEFYSKVKIGKKSLRNSKWAILISVIALVVSSSISLVALIHNWSR